MKNKKLIIKIASAVAAIALTVFALDFLTRLVTPKYMSGALDGAFIAEYYDETLPHDVVFVGDCEVFSNISPVSLYNEYGITSFVRGSAQQLIWQSYYLLEETFKYEKPSAVVFNVLSLVYNEPQNEAYNRITLDGMRLSASKLASVHVSMTEDESMIDYIFPLLRFHSRWSELTADDWKYLYHRDKVTHNGYYMRVDAKPAVNLPTPRPLDDYTFGSTAMGYLDRMTELCRENGVDLILMKAPSLVPHWYDEYDAQIVAYAEEHGLRYINVLAAADEIGIDYNADTFDAGMHLNVYGAEKVTSYIGKILRDEFSLPGHRGDPDYDTVWAEKTAFYDDMKESQLAELSELGHLVHFGAVAEE